MSLSAKLGMLEFITRYYTGRPSETSSKLLFWRLRQARGDEPVRRLNQELKVPRLSKPTAKQISVTGKSVRSRRKFVLRSEEHTSELQSLTNLVCRLLLEKKKNP